MRPGGGDGIRIAGRCSTGRVPVALTPTRPDCRPPTSKARNRQGMTPPGPPPSLHRKPTTPEAAIPTHRQIGNHSSPEWDTKATHPPEMPKKHLSVVVQLWTTDLRLYALRGTTTWDAVAANRRWLPVPAPAAVTSVVLAVG